MSRSNTVAFWSFTERKQTADEVNRVLLSLNKNHRQGRKDAHAAMAVRKTYLGRDGSGRLLSADQFINPGLEFCRHGRIDSTLQFPAETLERTFGILHFRQQRALVRTS